MHVHTHSLEVYMCMYIHVSVHVCDTCKALCPRSTSFRLCSSILAHVTALRLCKSATSAEMICTRQCVCVCVCVCVCKIKDALECFSRKKEKE